ncbi:MAG: S49 family peptidase [Phycisphaeraceae bacterium]|nr:S49 family peptidase [Phycisphaeraceae bacterium]
MSHAVVRWLAVCVAVLVFVSGTKARDSDAAGVVVLEVEGTPVEAAGPLAWLGMGETTLRDYVGMLHEAVWRDDVDAVFVRLKDTALGFTHVQELGEAMHAVREAGKRVIVYAENYGPTDLLLASYADESLIQRAGSVSFPGMHMEEIFLADTLAWIGMKADLVQVGDYKGANEMFTRSGPSEAWERNVTQLLDGLYAEMRATLKANRRLTDAELDAAMRDLWWGTAEEAVRHRLIDGEVDLDEIEDRLTSSLGAAVEWADELGASVQPPSMSDPFAVFRIFTQQPDHSATMPSIAVVYIDGAIVDGDSSQGGFLGESSVGSRTIRNALDDILHDDLILGVVVRIDSPGGSATASEVIWQGLRRVAAEKPVWVSVGSMAASGGYYIAVGGDRIYMNPSSIVGSIGVVGGKISMGPLYDRLKVRVTTRTRGPAGDMFSSTEPWSPAQVEQVRTKMKQTYDLFTRRVVAGRPGIDLSKTAEGRLFTAERAIALGMADEIGGLDACIEALAAELGLDEYDVLEFPGPKSIAELLEDLFGSALSTPGLSLPAGFADAAGELLGDQTWSQVRRGAAALMQLRREPVLLTLPQAIVVR